MTLANVGDVVQLVSDGWANDVLMEVEEVKTWGYLGIVHGPNGADYPMRVKYEETKQVWRRVPDA